MNGSHHIPTTKSTLFVVSKDECEDTGKSMKTALYEQQCLEAMLHSKKFKPVSLAIAELRLSKGIRQLL